MRSPAAPIAAATLLLLAASPAAAQDTALGRELDRLLAGEARWTVLVAEVATGETVYAHQADQALVPASNMKLLTTAAALDRLGPEFAHRTEVVLEGRLAGGVLAGDLWVVGGGDPTISRRFDPEPLLDEVARAVVAAGVRAIAGAVVVDDRAFDAVRLHPSWEASDAEKWYGAEVGALSLNDNCIDLAVSGSAEGPQAVTRPATGYVRIDLQARATSRKDRHVWSVTRAGDDKRILRITGRVWRGAGAYETSVPVVDPGLFFGEVLRERLIANGVAVAGGVRRCEADAPAPAGRAVWERSAPLPRTLRVTNQRSQNLYAECLLKTLGRLPDPEGAGLRPESALRPGGSWARGAAAVTAFARRCGAPASGVRVVDGSGLSRDNRLSARALVAVLRAVAGGPHGALFRETLAQPGGEGTLRRRLRRLPAGVTLRAKTGTLTGVAALSGYLQAPGRRWAFAAVVNGGGGRRALDRLVRALATHLTRDTDSR